MLLENRLKKDINKRAADNSLRALSPQDELIDFSSNDYLGFAKNMELFDTIALKHKKSPLNGSTGSRLLSGNSAYYQEVENKLALLFRAERALIFNSGYTANLALLSTIPQKGDTIIYDELAHACIKDGARLSLAKRFSFRHNDMSDLEQKIKRAEGQIFIVVESVYSMDGHQCPLNQVVKIANKYSANIIIDEAHTTGIRGTGGSGLTVELGLENEVFARVYTFGKAMGVHGAAIAGSKLLSQYLINFARPFIYTTALPIHSIISIEMSFDYLHKNPQLQKQVSNNVDFFNEQFSKKLSKELYKIKSNHPIQSVIISGNDAVKKANKSLMHHGLDVRPILSPTVKKGEERLRICLHSFNTNDDISRLIDTLAGLK